MQLRRFASTIGYLVSRRMLAIAVCLWATIAGAQTWNPTASDGSGNTAAGTDALSSLTTGVLNTAIGHSALYANTTGGYNTASGGGALGSNTTGSYNTAGGHNALGSNTTGSDNTASGMYALISNTTGSGNTGLGSGALSTNMTGRNNVAVGAQALYAIKGSNNIAVGFKAGSRTPSGGRNIYIGHPGNSAGESQVIRIGSNQTKTYIRGIAGVPLSGASVVVRASGQLGVVASSARYKQDIRPLNDASDKLAKLRPVSYRYRSEPQATHYGLIAEEVDKVMPELVVRDDRNRPESVQYLEIIPLLLQDRREQQTRIAKQEFELSRQRRVIERLAAQLAELRRTRLADTTALTRTARH